MKRSTAALSIAAVALSWLVVVALRSPADSPGHTALAQEEPPPIATCVPLDPSGSPTPPGLYPRLSFESATFSLTELRGVCVGEGSQTEFEVCVSNGGPGTLSEFTVRVQGCVETRFDIDFPVLDMFTEDCRSAPAKPIEGSDAPCEILVDAECMSGTSSRTGLHQIISLPTPEPFPRCTPGPSPTPSDTPAPTEPADTPTPMPSETEPLPVRPTRMPTADPAPRPLYVPIALANTGPIAPGAPVATKEPVATVTISATAPLPDTPTPVSTMTESPPNTPAPTPTEIPAPVPPDSPIIFQVADFGGHGWPPGTGAIRAPVGQAPRLTIHADGTTIRATGDDLMDWRAGRLSESELTGVMATLVVEAEILDYPAGDEIYRCVTDGSTTRLYVRSEEREHKHKIASYLMLWLGEDPSRCPGGPGAIGRPGTENFYRLAAAVVGVIETVAAEADEVPYMPEHSTVYSELPDSPHATPAPWPIAMPIEDAAGYDRLSPEDMGRLLAAIREHRTGETERIALFEDTDGPKFVTIRVEIPGWDMYDEPR